MKTVYLVSCVKQKAEDSRPAEELYISDWFKKARSYVESRIGPQDRWYILSAKYHLVEPSQIISPYNLTLNETSRPDRLQWGSYVLDQLRPIANAGDLVVILAGRKYREALESDLRARRCRVKVPMKGLGLGQQKAWLVRHTKH
jgi:cytoplasmic iron level regulating protein YaaA (DUF328/UPF0246 family)